VIVSHVGVVREIFGPSSRKGIELYIHDMIHTIDLNFYIARTYTCSNCHHDTTCIVYQHTNTCMHFIHYISRACMYNTILGLLAGLLVLLRIEAPQLLVW
jgi:hypothetical protein